MLSVVPTARHGSKPTVSCTQAPFKDRTNGCQIPFYTHLVNRRTAANLTALLNHSNHSITTIKSGLPSQLSKEMETNFQCTHTGLN